MSEQIVQIENVNPSDLYGANDQYLTMIKSFFPKIKIIARGDFIKIIGKDEEVEYFIKRLNLLRDFPLFAPRAPPARQD